MTTDQFNKKRKAAESESYADAKAPKRTITHKADFEAKARATFAPHDVSLAIGNKSMTIRADFSNGSTVAGVFAIDKSRDLNQIDWDALSAVKTRAEGACDTLYVVGDMNHTSRSGNLCYRVLCNHSKIKHAVFLSTYTKLPDKALWHMAELEDVVLPENITEIGDSAFLGCSALVDINLPDTLIAIGAGAFVGCDSLTRIDIPDSVTEIDRLAFSGCTGLSFESAHFSLSGHMLVNTDEKKVLRCVDTSATHITVPAGIEIIGAKAFCFNEVLHSVDLPAGLRVIDAGAFFGCSELQSIDLPESLEVIGECALSNLALKSVVIPNPDVRMGSYAFGNCLELTEVILPPGLTRRMVKKYFKDTPWYKNQRP